MKIIVLPDSFGFSFKEAEANKSNKVSMKILFESEKECSAYCTAYRNCNENLNFKNLIPDVTGQEVKEEHKNSQDNLEVNVKWSRPDKTLDARDIIKKIAVRLQNISVIGVEQYNAILVEADYFKQPIISDNNFFEEYDRFSLAVTNTSVQSELVGRRVNNAQGWQGTKAIRIVHETSFQGAEAKKGEQQESYYPGLACDSYYGLSLPGRGNSKRPIPAISVLGPK